MNERRAAAVAVLLAAGLLGLASRRDGRAPIVPAASAPVAVAPAPHRMPPPPSRPPDAAPPDAGRAPEDPADTYRRFAVYPPTSRPLVAEDRHLIEWNGRYEQPRPAEGDPGLSVLFTADRFWVTGDETLTARLELRRGGAPVQARVEGAVVAGGARTPVDFAAADDGYVAVIAPDDLALKSATRVRVEADFEPAGAPPQHAELAFVATPPASVPARFTGAFRDAVEDGSLVVHAGVEVSSPGRYLVDANLFGADGRPIAWTRFKGPLPAGAAEVPLRFFGKVLTDAGVPGPYTVSQLRGARHDPGRDPDREMMPPYEGTWTTSPWPVDAFSPAEWDDPHKRATLAHLEALRGAPDAPEVFTPR